MAFPDDGQRPAPVSGEETVNANRRLMDVRPVAAGTPTTRWTTRKDKDKDGQPHKPGPEDPHEPAVKP